MHTNKDGSIDEKEFLKLPKLRSGNVPESILKAVDNIRIGLHLEKAYKKERMGAYKNLLFLKGKPMEEAFMRWKELWAVPLKMAQVDDQWGSYMTSGGARKTNYSHVALSIPFNNSHVTVNNFVIKFTGLNPL